MHCCTLVTLQIKGLIEHYPSTSRTNINALLIRASEKRGLLHFADCTRCASSPAVSNQLNRSSQLR